MGNHDIPSSSLEKQKGVDTPINALKSPTQGDKSVSAAGFKPRAPQQLG